ncbi:polysaccharide pyruvyl transferase family protein [Faecalicatena contorta]|uniref:polysaccharide pyruvyl transferase family protein n=1 Tax=Faecalicatena contorta TaxID=39482 RepID=UPI00129ECCD1|nr:polysaccharide pyruvyl transferase family protein [Faecalicatena contorta]MRM90670.1 polysaccharide pyruvyl transferase family protein [Faecalicatena contorta]
MKYGIITFHFAHNYGAMLQAKALKDYISELNENTEIINYVPKTMMQFYQINPFRKKIGIKNFFYGCMNLPRRIKQYRIFQNFYRQELDCIGKPITNKRKFIEYRDEVDVVICGSDQIWNGKLTSWDDIYYGGALGGKSKRISYAASFGGVNIDTFQKKCIENFLPDFVSISLREEDGFQEILELINIKPEIVLDPVFLLDEPYWSKLAEKSVYKTNEKFVLYYSLKEDKELIELTERIARYNGLNILAIHPICQKHHICAVNLRCIGPNEFLYLIKNAEYVCTNSFHASAFSIIFEKKILHKSFPGKETRVESLFRRTGAFSNKVEPIDNIPIMDLSKVDHGKIKTEIQHSREFLLKSLHKCQSEQ